MPSDLDHGLVGFGGGQLPSGRALRCRPALQRGTVAGGRFTRNCGGTRPLRRALRAHLRGRWVDGRKPHHAHGAPRQIANVVVVHLRRNFGKAAALQAGFLEAAARPSSPSTPISRTTLPRSEAAREARRGLRPRLGLEEEAKRPVDAAYPLARLQLVHRLRLRRAAPRRQLRAEGLSGGSAARDAHLRRAPSLHPGSRLLPWLPYRRGSVITARGCTVDRATGEVATMRGFFDLLTVTFMSRYRHRPLHLFGGLGLFMCFVGFLLLTYLTMSRSAGRVSANDRFSRSGCLSWSSAFSSSRSGSSPNSSHRSTRSA